MKIVALAGVGDVPQSSALVAWGALIALTGFVFWATLNPPRIPRF